jgi:isopentenyldiphosphate isomerase
MTEEYFDIVTEDGTVVGRATRSECHGNPSLLHPVVHVLVCDSTGRLFLQQRAHTKDIQPGKWDTSVGGHLLPGEDPETGARREMTEELGVTPDPLTFAYQYLWRSDRESELVRTYYTLHDGPFSLHPDEIETGRFWSIPEIRQTLGTGAFTPNFEQEFTAFLAWRNQLPPDFL